MQKFLYHPFVVIFSLELSSGNVTGVFCTDVSCNYKQTAVPATYFYFINYCFAFHLCKSIQGNGYGHEVLLS